MADLYYSLAPWRLTTDPILGTPVFEPPVGTRGLVDLRPADLAGGFGFFATEAALPANRNVLALGRGREALAGQALVDEWRARLGIGSAMAPMSVLDLLWQTLTAQGDGRGTNRCKPVLPTHRGMLELHLGGHSLVRSRRFEGEADPAWDGVRAVVQEDYRRIREESLAGETTRDRELYLRWLATQEAKLGVRYDRLIPDDLPDEGTRTPETTITDDFDRATTAYGSGVTDSAEGWSWSETATLRWAIFAATDLAPEASSSAGELRADSDLSSDDHYSQNVIEQDGSGTTSTVIGASVRFSSSARTFYVMRINNATTKQCVLYRYAAGTGTVIGTAQNVTISLPQTVKCQADGSTVKGFFDGSEEYSVTDTNITGNTRTGIGIAFVNNTLSSGVLRVGSFESADLEAGGGFQAAWARGSNQLIAGGLG